MNIKRIPLSQVMTSRTQTRATINMNVVDEYAERMEEGDVFPPIRVFTMGDVYDLSRGFHRVMASRKVGYMEIDAEIKEGNVWDAILDGAEDNGNHGHRRTLEDKRRSVTMYIQAMQAKHENWSDREIAKRVGVSHDLVGSMRLATGGNASQIRTGADGRTINTANIGKRKESAHPATDNEGQTDDGNWRETDDTGNDRSDENIPQVQAARSMPAVNDDGEIVDSLDALIQAGRKFACIYADPPWKYGNQATRAATDNHYPTMTVEEIAALPVAQVAADDALIHLWTTSSFLHDAFHILEAWGFDYKACFVWVKPQMGIGNYWRMSHELMLTARRGEGAFRDHGLMSWLREDRTLHSAKPETVRQFVEKASSGPRLELFGRRRVSGWTVLGNQIEDDGLFTPSEFAGVQ